MFEQIDSKRLQVALAESAEKRVGQKAARVNTALDKYVPAPYFSGGGGGGGSDIRSPPALVISGYLTDIQTDGRRIIINVARNL